MISEESKFISLEPIQDIDVEILYIDRSICEGIIGNLDEFEKIKKCKTFLFYKTDLDTENKCACFYKVISAKKGRLNDGFICFTLKVERLTNLNFRKSGELIWK